MQSFTKVLFAAFCAVFALFFAACESEVNIDKIDTSKPFKLEIFKGKSVKIQVSENAIVSSVKKPAVYSFFASWCASCKVEAQILSNLREKFGEKVQIIGVLMEDLNAQEVEKFKAEFGINYDIAVGAGNLIFDKALNNTFGVPLIVVADAQGRILLRHSGVVDGTRLQSLLDGLL